MKILFHWSMRMLQEDPPQTVFTILNLVFSYMLLTGLKLLMRHRISIDNTDGDGMLWYIATILSVVIIFTTLLTMFNAFRTSIHERRHRYEMLSAAGATDRQIRGSLFLEALVINCIGALVGMTLGLTLFVVIKQHSQQPPGEHSYWLQGLQLLLPTIHPQSKALFDGFSYMPTPQRGMFCLLPEFLMVPTAMAMAAGKHMPQRAKEKQKPRRMIRAEQLSLGRVLGRMFGVGGEINRLMDKRERSRRRFFLSVFVVSIAALAITLNMFSLVVISVDTDKKSDLYLRTSGDSIPFETWLDEYLVGDQFHNAAEEVRICRCYLPRVYCVLTDDRIEPQRLDELRDKSVRQQPFLYPIADSRTKLVTPQMIFVQEGEFEILCMQCGGEGDTNAVLLPGESIKGKDFTWLASDTGAQQWDLCFYTDPAARYMISDARTKAEEKAQNIKTGDGSKEIPSDKVRPEYSCRSAKEYLEKVRDRTTETIKVNVRQLPSNEFSRHDWDVNRAVPTLVFPKSAAYSFKAHLQDTNEGVRMSAQARNDTAQLYHVLGKALQTSSEGYVAEHAFGSGTRYHRGENWSGEFEHPSHIPILHLFSYKAPKLIYADMYLQMDTALKSELVWMIGTTIALMLFTLLTNIINAVNGHHILRRHDYAVLRSCGMSEKQMRRAIRYEAVWYSVHSMLYGFVGYLLLFPGCLVALAYGVSYERVLQQETEFLAEWCKDFPTILQNAFVNFKHNFFYLRWIFPAAGVIVFALFLTTNYFVRRRMRSDVLVPLLKKDI